MINIQIHVYINVLIQHNNFINKNSSSYMLKVTDRYSLKGLVITIPYISY